MPMDKDTVRKVATLARIELTGEALDRQTERLGGILTWIEQLNEVNTEGVEPLANVVDITLKLRADALTDGGDTQKILSNAPEEVGSYYVVPKVVE